MDFNRRVFIWFVSSCTERLINKLKLVTQKMIDYYLLSDLYEGIHRDQLTSHKETYV